MSYEHDIEACFEDEIGPGGLDRAAFQTLAGDAFAGLGQVREWRAKGGLPLFQLPDRRDDLDALFDTALRLRAFRDVVILGTGGSSLGGQALYEMAYSDYERRQAGIPRLHIVTNIDPFNFESFVARLDMSQTALIVISKSGGTAETLMQFLTILPLIREAVGEAALADRVVAITEPDDNPLRRVAGRLGIPVLDHDSRVGGRYSVLSLVGMLPAMIAGLDAHGVRFGARAVLDQALAASDPPTVPPVAGAAVSVGLARHRAIAGTVMLAYSDRLGSLARWYRQLWAESLGKRGEGTTPIYGTGPVDQHSQLQLWLDGPKDKMFSVLSGPVPRSDRRVDPKLADDPDLAYMAGRTLGEAMQAMCQATTETLIEHGRPTRRIALSRIDEISVGALMMHFMLETILSARLIGVDPFDQPAVEHGKKLARRYLAQAGGAALAVKRPKRADAP